MNETRVKLNLDFYKHNLTMSMGYTTQGLRDDAQEAFQLLRNLNKAGITLEQLEALAEGQAWITTLEDADDLALIWGDQCFAITENNEKVSTLNLECGWTSGDPKKVFLFNGIHFIPEPKGE